MIHTYGGMEFPKKLRHHMKGQRLSQEAIAAALAVSQGLVSRWTRGANVPDVYQGKALADVLKLSLDYLVDENQPPLSEQQAELVRDVARLIRTIGVEDAYRRLAQPQPDLQPTPIHPDEFRRGIGLRKPDTG